MLHVVEHQIRVLQDGAVVPQPNAGGVQAGVDAGGMEPREHLGQKFRLQKGLPAGEGDAAAPGEVGAEAQQLGGEGLRGELRAAGGPGVGIVAVAAPQGTALQKHHRPHAGAVHQPHGLHRVDVSDQMTLLSARKTKKTARAP